LLLLVALAGGAAWAGASGWMFVELRSQVNRVLDAKLVEAAGLVQTLWQRRPGATGARSPGANGAAAASGARRLACQVWDVDGTLLTRSGGAPDSPLAGIDRGFANVTVDGEAWRVYAASDGDGGRRVLVGERRALRQELANRIAMALAVPFLVGLPALALGLGLGVRHGLRPLREVAGRVARMDPRDEGSWETPATPTPREITPLMRALSGLVGRLRTTLERERRFLGDAAHQLRTPLAALKTQAQVALDSPEPQQREHALHQVVAGAERADRLVQQLLTLARFEEAGPAEGEPVDLKRTVERVLATLAGQAASRGTRLEADLPSEPVTVRGNPEALESLLANLVDNALRHGRADGRVDVRLFPHPPVLEVADDGPGLAPEARERALARFHRLAGSGAPGSGLGLPIAARVAELHHGSLELAQGSDGRGLRVTVRLPAPDTA
jgi:two-component system sensor histidine kinase QseC